MSSLDFRDVEETGGTADECASGEMEFRDGLETAFVEDSGTVGEAFTAFQEILEEWVVFHSLRENDVSKDPCFDHSRLTWNSLYGERYGFS